MFKVTGRSGGFLAITTAAASFLHHHYLIEATEVDVENACELAAI